MSIAENLISPKRIQNEIEHGKFLASHDADEIWNWTTPAGKIRWQRRSGLLMGSLISGMKVLELGCGTGLLTREIVTKKVLLTSIDISPDLMEIAKKNIIDSNVEFIIENACQMSFNDQTFNAVIGSSVLHHLDIDSALSEIFRVLKPGGHIVFTEPNMMNPQIAFQKNIKFLKKTIGDSPDESAFFTWSVRKKLQKTGFTRIKVIPFDFLHPRIPEKMINNMLPFIDLAEKIPVLRQLSGSLLISAIK